MRQDIEGRYCICHLYLPPNDKLYFAMNLTKKLFAILLIIVLSSIFRLVLINQSFWLDEAAQALESMRPLAEQLHISGDFNLRFFTL